MTIFDEVPIEVRRENWGWFGDPWPSEICYDEDNRLIEEMRKPFPRGENCLYCGEPLVEFTDSGMAMPYGAQNVTVRHVHKECLLRMTVGSVSCLMGSHDHEDDGKTYRQQALEAWEWVQEQGGL